MSWQFVFNTRLGVWTREEAFRSAKDAKYPFILWNEDVYTADGVKTPVKASDLF